MKYFVITGCLLASLLQLSSQSFVYAEDEIDRAIVAYWQQVIEQKSQCDVYLETLDSVIQEMAIDKSLRLDYRRRLRNMGKDKSQFFDIHNDIEHFTENELEYLSRFTDFDLVPLVGYCRLALGRLLYLKRAALIDKDYSYTRNKIFLEQIQFYQLQPYSSVGMVGLEGGSILGIVSQLEGLELYINVMEDDYVKSLQKQYSDAFIVYGQETSVELEGLGLDKILLGNIHRFKNKDLILQSLKASLNSKGRLILSVSVLKRSYPRTMERDDVVQLLERHGFELVRERGYYEGRYYLQEYKLN
jgi:virulence-associated protein VapD